MFEREQLRRRSFTAAKSGLEPVQAPNLING